MPEIIFFWGHHAKTPGVIGPHVFSQWWPAPFVENGITYPTAEHYMMCAKADLCKDAESRAAILADPDPARAKKLGRLIKNWDEALWAKHRLDVVIDGSTLKFDQNKELGDYLVSTGEATLVEASPYDKIWGIGMKADDPRALHPLQWDGLNLLGIALMVARGNLVLQRHIDSHD